MRKKWKKYRRKRKEIIIDKSRHRNVPIKKYKVSKKNIAKETNV